MALTNVLTKIISKVIANLLKPLLPKLIAPNQGAFIPGRQACDNFIIAQELIHSMKHKSGKKGTMVIKIDLEKAYDKVSWSCLKMIIKVVGFKLKLAELIMHTITSAQLSLIWNAEQLTPFRPTRGIRQGDPLASYLFLLCMEILGQLINKVVDEGRWKPVKASRGGPGVSHIFFADDLLLFGEAT